MLFFFVTKKAIKNQTGSAWNFPQSPLLVYRMAPQPMISKSTLHYSAILSSSKNISTPRSGLLKWHTKIIISIATLVLHNYPQGCIFSRPLTTLSLSWVSANIFTIAPLGETEGSYHHTKQCFLQKSIFQKGVQKETMATNTVFSIWSVRLALA